ncbi:hypothetical protein [Cupriavidus sp. AcVe19-6a]|uniref:hypothetical protein n=1 Tax=Cupriavidus sp. AcVe19-6a TaxID=2821358 RepID=UPI001AE37C6C|nr:hypothetical protein [Cupriavidus sp. AcVe19-6a]MBP0639839.1 hypothetical protein [Cupriavidus sp. AcVe19-6a]
MYHLNPQGNDKWVRLAIAHYWANPEVAFPCVGWTILTGGFSGLTKDSLHCSDGEIISSRLLLQIYSSRLLGGTTNDALQHNAIRHPRAVLMGVGEFGGPPTPSFFTAEEYAKIYVHFERKPCDAFIAEDKMRASPPQPRPSVLKLAVTTLIATTLVVLAAMLLRAINGNDVSPQRWEDLRNTTERAGDSDARSECQRFHERLVAQAAGSDVSLDMGRRAWFWNHE